VARGPGYRPLHRPRQRDLAVRRPGRRFPTRCHPPTGRHVSVGARAAAARGSPIVVVSDGEIADRAALPADLLRRARIVVLPRPAFFDAFVAGIDGPRRVQSSDTIRLKVSYGTAGRRDTGHGKRAALVVSVGDRRLIAKDVMLPDSGIIATELTFPASRVPSRGWSSLQIRLDGRRRLRAARRRPGVRSRGEPAAGRGPARRAAHVGIALPGAHPGGRGARAAARVRRSGAGAMARRRDARARRRRGRAAGGAAGAARRLVGDPGALAGIATPGALLVWPTTGGRDGDWYVEPPSASPLAGYLAGIPWDSLPPASAVSDLPPDTGALPVLQARLARRGASRPIAVLSEQRGSRRATVAATGLWRWDFAAGRATWRTAR